jgi:2-keto-4-pentenoate hydratase/2-oxohepta-3-ene-1,7-dioic acid hydratase in catechol pathway
MDVMSYLSALPHSESAARQLHEWASGRRSELVPHCHALRDVRLLSPVPKAPALFDFALTPRHLRNSARTLLRHEYGKLVGGLAAFPLGRGITRQSRSPVLLYYKGNHCEIIGDGDVTGWPAYSSYLDIEPELACVVGNAAQPLGGYTIFNDMSARDVQMPEMMGSGPARSKDFARSNGLGPYLVTPDEIPDPRKLAVHVSIRTRAGAERFSWRGNTLEYSRAPEDALRFLGTIFTPPPGTVVGLGTIPDCTGLDHDHWLEPGDRVEIRMERLGCLRQQIPSVLPILERSRWRARPELAAYSSSAPPVTG